MNAVCVLGDGQLGRMLRQAGEPLGIRVFPVGMNANPKDIPFETSVITAEIEHWPETLLTQTLAVHPHFVNRMIFPIIADRKSQKTLLDDLNLPTAPWCSLSHLKQIPNLFELLGPDIIIKRRIGGYDGRGQHRITSRHCIPLPEDIYGNAIAEQCIPFDGEVSLIGARNQQGECVFYPLTWNYHENGLLKVSVAVPKKTVVYQQQAEAMLTRLMQHMEYIGVMAMECFLVGDRIVINELAPRVHNSGHWTQNGASVSQFELHLRAILNLPLVKPQVNAFSIMINLLGIPRDYAWLSLPYVHLHWYDKIIRENRKVGHLNLSHVNKQCVCELLPQLNRYLPESYDQALRWAEERLMVE